MGPVVMGLPDQCSAGSTTPLSQLRCSMATLESRAKPNLSNHFTGHLSDFYCGGQKIFQEFSQQSILSEQCYRSNASRSLKHTRTSINSAISIGSSYTHYSGKTLIAISII